MSKKKGKPRRQKADWELIPNALTRLQNNRGTRVFGPVGSCIYCLAETYTNDGGSLRTEHVVPSGLDGQLLLREASCQRCEKLTNSFETPFLTSIRGLRYSQNVKGKKRASPRPSALPLKVGSTTVEVPVEDYPATAVFPLVPRCRLLRDAGPDQGTLRLIYSADFDGLINSYGIDSFDVTFERVSFYRTIAKIAHAYLVAKFSLGAFEPTLLGIIDGTDTDYQRLIGCVEGSLRDNDLWSLQPSLYPHEGQVFLTVLIQLFGRLGGPLYEVVGGVFSDEQKHGEALVAAFEALQRPQRSTSDL